MRSLSLGVLIVCGGTLAALPFRRYQALPDASALPTQVTGPTESVLNEAPVDQGSSAIDQLPSLADADRLQELRNTYGQGTANANAAMTSRRSIEIPLTYEDLAVPIDQPKPVMQRFSATTVVRQQQLEKDRLAGLTMPSMENLPLDQQAEIQRVAESVGLQETADRQAAGRLASTPSAGPTDYANDSWTTRQPMQSAQQSQEDNRQRHWIRQPN